MANLLEEASILLTPTAYNNGSMLAVKPSENLLGDELSSNGDFATDSVWAKDANWSIADGKATSTGAGRMFQSIPFLETNVGTKVVVSFDIVDYTSGGVVIQCYGGLSETFTGVGTHTFTTVTTNTLNFYINNSGQGNLVGSIDNVSVKEDLSGDFTFSRNSAATRVNAQGLVENVQILSSNLVSNGDFSQEGAEEVSNGSFSQEGSEQVTNGNFATDSDWTTNDWNISEGTLNGSASTGIVFQANLGTTIGKTYKVVLEISNYTSGSIRFKVGGASYQNILSEDGVQEFYFVSSTTSNNILFSTLSAYTGSIDNVSVKEVGQDWNTASNWTISNGSANADGSSGGLLSQSTTPTVIGKIYKVEYTILNYVSGSFRFSYGGTSESFHTSNGTYTSYRVATNTNSTLSSSSINFIGSITNVSIKEVGQDWTFGTGWSIGDSVANAVNAPFGSQLVDSATLTASKKYSVSFVISNYIQGVVRVAVGNVFSSDVSANGSYTFTLTSANTNAFKVQAMGGGSGTILSITNISVVEITDETNLPRINYEGFSYQDILGSEEVVNGGFSNGTTNWNAVRGNIQSVNDEGVFTLGGTELNSLVQSNVLTVGKSYLLEFYAKSDTYNTNIFTAYLGVDNIVQEQTVSSEFQKWSYYISPNQTNLQLGIFYSALYENIIFDNISVKEFIGQEVVPNSGCGSWLLEPQSTNSIQSSNTITAMSYTTGLTRSDNAAISPNGELNAMSFVPTASGVHRSGYSTLGGTYNQGDIVTFSGFVKANGYDFVTMGGFFGGEKAVFNISNGTLVSQESNVIDTKIVKLTNDWYKLSTTYTFQNNIGNSLLYAGIYVMNTETGITFTGDGVSGVYGYGFQAEQQSFATSYIPTQGAASTRLKDIANNSGNASYFNDSEGVLYAEISRTLNEGTYSFISVSSNSLDSMISLGKGYNTNKLIIYVKLGGVTVFSDTTIDFKDSFQKVAIKYKSGQSSVFIDGIEVLTSSNAFTTTVPLEVLRFSWQSDTSSIFYGKTKALAVFKTALTDEQLTALTTI